MSSNFYLPGAAEYVELQHIIDDIRDFNKGDFLKQKIIEYNDIYGENIFVKFPRFSKLLHEAFKNNSIILTKILLDFGADLNYGNDITIFNSIINFMIDNIFLLINRKDKYLMIENDLENIINNIVNGNIDELDELMDLLEGHGYDEDFIQEIIDEDFENTSVIIEMERISRILLLGKYIPHSREIIYKLNINETLDLYYNFFKIYLNYPIDYNKGERNFEVITGDNDYNDEENIKKAIKLILLVLDKAKYNPLIKAKQRLLLQRLSLSRYYNLADDLTEKTSEYLNSMPYDPNVMRRIKEEDDPYTEWLQDRSQLGSGQRSKKHKTKKRLYRFN